MTVIGTVQNGHIVLPPGVSLPEGAEVSVEILKAVPSVPPAASAADRSDEEPIDGYALNRELLKFAGIVKGFPKDSSVNLDHYLYGVPKNE